MEALYQGNLSKGYLATPPETHFALLKGFFMPSHSCEICQRHYSYARLAQMFDVSKKTIQRIVHDPQHNIRVVMVCQRPRVPHSELPKFTRDYLG